MGTTQRGKGAARTRLEARWGLPAEVKFCSRCVVSNQYPTSSVEFKHTKAHKHRAIAFDEKGVCDACRYSDHKGAIDWKRRESELLKLLERHRRDDGHYDVIVPGSGGKDSVLAAHVLKYKYGMHPLTVTWPPFMYTDYGYRNFRNWIEIGGFDNISYNWNGRVMKLVTRLGIENLLHPFQTFILGQKNVAPRLAIKFGVPLIMYGENEAEYGNPIADNATSLRDKSFYTMRHLDEVSLGGVPIKELQEKHKVPLADLMPYLPVDYRDLERSNIEVHYLGYYVKWTPQEAYYYAAENCGFKARPFRTQGSYSKYNSIDDKIDDLHYYTTYIKFGIGRATYEAAQEIRNKHLTREEGLALVKRFDGEFPDRYFKEIMEFVGMKPERFHELCDEFRSPHLWAKADGKWRLRHTANKDGVDD
jgi:N-acetyl sugar amidotransferase